VSPAAPRKPVSKAPSLREERRLLRDGHAWLAAVDEVGRGALAGPVSVGVVVIDAATRSAPAGVRDSKLLTPAARQALVPRLRRWAPMHAVGHASAPEIDAIGIVAALRLAACRALATLPVRPDCALLDGSHNWLSLPVTAVPEPPPQEEGLFELPADAVPADASMATSMAAEVHAGIVPARVVTQVKADLRCAAVAAASVLAKVERDAIMVELASRFPRYGWELNKGYSAPEHIAALRRYGPSALHRQSWNLPGAGDPQSEELDLEGLDPLGPADRPASADPSWSSDPAAEEESGADLVAVDLAELEPFDEMLDLAGASGAFEAAGAFGTDGAGARR
jgi:ribonuclease HII